MLWTLGSDSALVQALLQACETFGPHCKQEDNSRACGEEGWYFERALNEIYMKHHSIRINSFKIYLFSLLLLHVFCIVTILKKLHEDKTFQLCQLILPHGIFKNI